MSIESMSKFKVDDKVKMKETPDRWDKNEEGVIQYIDFDLVSDSEPSDHSSSNANTINEMSRSIYANNKAVGWWTDEDEALEAKARATLIASKLALVHSEISEALEGMRKGLMDDHLPHRQMVEVELADTIIRILDLAGYMKLDLGGAIIEKLDYNKSRADHKLENRSKDGGKTI